MEAFSNEFRLVLACCRWPVTPEVRDCVARAAAGVDWEQAERVARRHRVEGLVWNALREAAVEVPAGTAQALAASATDIARQNLFIVHECLRLDTLLRQAGIPVLFLKGITLARLAYGTVGLKRGWDIDFIVPPEAVGAAAELLNQAGYECTLPGPSHSAAGIAAWHRNSKESVWNHVTKEVHVELHTSLSDNRRLLPELSAASPAQEAEVAAGRTLRTLEHDRLFAYLCVHGASSGWFRLKWLADLGAFLAGQSPAEIERLYRRAGEFGAGRSAAQGLLLSSRLLGTELTRALEAELNADRVNRWLVKSAIRLMTGLNEATELHHRRLGTLPIHLMQLALLPGWRFKVSEASRQLREVSGRAAGLLRG
ncbi:MAG TPA: nucleotidyltransferase family protein [Allosphingosinicella sp.]|nr:nucleotidyltransferase family protein [Allosphingosinicella sp.]